MIEKTEILEQICLALAAADPDCAAIYQDDVPADFLRPSYLVECVQLEHRDASRWIIRVTAQFAVTCLGRVDERRRGTAAELLAMQEKALSIFARGFLPVGDRALGVKAGGGGKSEDSAGVDVTLEYLDDRPEGRGNFLPMGEVHTAFAETEGGA